MPEATKLGDALTEALGKSKNPVLDAVRQLRELKAAHSSAVLNGEVVRPLDELIQDWIKAGGGNSRWVPDGGSWCQYCSGNRWVRQDVLPGHAEFGKLRRCSDCIQEGQAERVASLAQAASLSPFERSKTFKTFTQVPGAMGALNAAQQWGWSPDGWLVIFGEHGVGKTHLALAVVNALLEREKPVAYYYVPDLLRQAKVAVGEGDLDELHEKLLAESPLVLDDFGAGQGTTFEILSLLEPMANWRYRKRLPTLFTCLGGPEGIRDQLSESIGRRMQDPEVSMAIRNEAPQWRAA